MKPVSQKSNMNDVKELVMYHHHLRHISLSNQLNDAIVGKGKISCQTFLQDRKKNKILRHGKWNINGRAFEKENPQKVGHIKQQSDRLSRNSSKEVIVDGKPVSVGKTVDKVPTKESRIDCE